MFAGDKGRINQVENWVRVYSPELFAFAMLRLNNKQDAEDILQLTFLKAFRGFGSFKSNSDPRAWLFTIMLNNIKDLSRRRSKRPMQVDLDDDQILSELITDTASNPESILLEKERQISLARAIASLPEQFAIPLILKESSNFSYQEIASTLAIPVGTVMSRLSRARKALTLFLKNEEKSSIPANKPGGAA